MFNFATLAFSLQSSLHTSGITLKRSHAQEVIAAMLGYNAYAAVTSSARTGLGHQSLAQAEHVLLQPALAKKRAVSLGMTDADAAVCVDEAAKTLIGGAQATDVRVWASFEDFRDNYLEQHMGEVAESSEEASAAMAETNAYSDYVYVEGVEEETDILDPAGTWTVVGNGQIDMDQDTEKPFHGDKVLFSIRLFFEKVDRVGLVQIDSEVSAGLDDSWRDDHDDPLDL